MRKPVLDPEGLHRAAWWRLYAVRGIKLRQAVVAEWSTTDCILVLDWIEKSGPMPERLRTTLKMRDCMRRDRKKGAAWLRIVLALVALGAAGLWLISGAEAARVDVVGPQTPGDSIRVAISWREAERATHYLLRWEGPEPWVRERPAITGTVDTVWVRLGPTETVGRLCVTAITRLGSRERRSAPACAEALLPPELLPPGSPAPVGVTPLGDLAHHVDSIRFVVLRRDLTALGDNLTIEYVVWMGGVPVQCVTLTSGARGWREVTVGPDGLPMHADTALFAEDPSCGLDWEWGTSDPTVVTVEPVSIPVRRL